MKKYVIALLSALIVFTCVLPVAAEDQTVAVSFEESESYEWSIPTDSIDLSSASKEQKVTVTKNVIGDGRTLQISLSSQNDFYLVDTEHSTNKLQYQAKVDGEVITNGETILEVNAGTNTAEKTVSLVLVDKVTKSGNYKDKLTYTAAVVGQEIVKETLAAPTISISGSLLKITAVANANAYEIYADGTLYTTVTATSYSLPESLNDNTLYVIAIDTNGAYNASAMSNTVNYINKCLLAGSQVYMADGSYKNIEDIEAGDRVIAYDMINGGTYITNVLKLSVKDFTGDYYEIETENGHIVNATANHVFITEGNIPANINGSIGAEIALGTKIITFEGLSPVKSIKKKHAENIKVYDIDTVDDDETPETDDSTYDTFVVDGFTSHNHTG